MLNKLLEHVQDDLGVIIAALQDAYPELRENQQQASPPGLMISHDAPVGLATESASQGNRIPWQTPESATRSSFRDVFRTRWFLLSIGIICLVLAGLLITTNEHARVAFGNFMWEHNEKDSACHAYKLACQTGVGNQGFAGAGCKKLAEEEIYKRCQPGIPEKDLLAYACREKIAYACLRRGNLMIEADTAQFLYLNAAWDDFRSACDLAEGLRRGSNSDQAKIIAMGCLKTGFRNIQNGDIYNGLRFMYLACELGLPSACEQANIHIQVRCTQKP